MRNEPMTAHTPGPWHVGGNAGRIVYDADGRAVGNATVYHGSWQLDRMQANARLIAAAPDLLTSCEAFVTAADLPAGIAPSPIMVEAMISAAQAAIAKAKGVQG
jgi:hypothetical protein